jgi:gliding motility-associated-like protein
VPRFLTFLFVLIAGRAISQCGYPVTLHTTKDYCVGSSLIASSTHALQKIVWYRNGQPVSTTLGTQSLSTTPTSVAILPSGTTFVSSYACPYLESDNAGNIYYLVNGVQQQQIWERAPSGSITQLAAFTNDTSMQVESITVAPSGEIYISAFLHTGQPILTAAFYDIPPGASASDPMDLPVAIPSSAIPADALPGAVAQDCSGNFYLFVEQYGQDTSLLLRYTPGAGLATPIGMATGQGYNCFLDARQGKMQLDSAGNLFFVYGSSIMKLAPGAAAPEVAVPGNCMTDPGRTVSDFWMDGKDTIYLTGINNTGNNFIEKWAPGATTGQTLVSFPLSDNHLASTLPITMDIRGNIYVSYAPYFPNVNEYKRTTSIDSAFTPTDTGAYYAVVTDIQGYTTTSDTIHINDPTAGPPSIQITATATSTPVCTPITFTAQVTNPGYDPSYHWQVSGVPAGGDSTSYSYNLFANGDEVYCILSTQAGCAGPVQDTSNIITLNIDPQGAASVTIAASKDPICQGDAVTLTATVTNGSNTPFFQWLLNGDSTTDDSVTYSRNNFANNDVITCLITSDDACGLAKSNSITMTVSALPTVQSGQIYTILHGQSVTLDPVITGDISSYLWTPATGLSDPTIANPVADPAVNTYYTLTVTAAGGCSDSGTMLVNVYTPLSIPNAFTPNGDGRNDIFYVLGGPVNSMVEDFAVYDRLGVQVFHVHDVAPGDPSKGWNGYFRGTPAPLGTYVYSVVMKMGDGSRQAYKGTVILIR